MLKYDPTCPIILVGTDNIVGEKMAGGRVAPEEIEKLTREIGAYKYIPLLTLQNSPETVFSEAARAAFSHYSENASGEKMEQCTIS